MSQIVAISKNQPALGHAYDARKKSSHANGRSTLVCVVYKGFQEGSYLVTDSSLKLYRAKRISSFDKEPVFEFKATDLVTA